MKKCTLFLAMLLAIVACEQVEPTPDPNPNPNPNPNPTPEAEFKVTVHEDKLTAWSVVFDIEPAKKDATYFFDVISKARWEQSDLKDLQAEKEEAIRKLAEMSNATYEEALTGMLFKGDELEVYSGAGYRASTDFYIYVYYWDANGPSDKVTLCPFSTPEVVESKEAVAVTFEEVEPYSMKVVYKPTSGVSEYWYYFAEISKVKAATADEEAFCSFHSMNVGLRTSGEQTILQQGLKPETDYAVAVMGIDAAGNRFVEYVEQKSAAVQENVRVESELFTALLGEWSGRQEVLDTYNNTTTTSNFNVTIVSEVADLDYDYRAQNQLVALVDGWNNIKYYGIKDLEEQYEGMDDAPVPAEVFGPKWVFDIAEGDKVSLDGQAHHSTVGWMFYGDCYMLNVEGANIYTSHDFEVEVSADRNTITISSPESLAGAYPSLAYLFTGVGWMSYSCGASDIVLTRK